MFSSEMRQKLLQVARQNEEVSKARMLSRMRLSILKSEKEEALFFSLLAAKRTKKDYARISSENISAKKSRRETRAYNKGRAVFS